MSDLEKKIGLILVGLVALISFSPLLYANINTSWNVFYERQSKAVYKASGIPLEDSQSYLGRANTFIPGYFAFKAGWIKLSYLPFDVAGRTVFKLCVNLFLLFSALYFADSLNFKKKQKIIFLGILLTQAMVFDWLLAYPLHNLGLGFFLFALGFGLKHESVLKNDLTVGVVTGLAGAIHATYIVMFILYYPLKKDLKATLKPLAIGAVTTLLIYSRTLFLEGLPYSIEFSNWGYGIKGSFPSFLIYFSLLAPIVLITIYMALRESGKDKMLLWTVIILLAGYLFVSRRFNVFLGLMIGVLAAKKLKPSSYPKLFKMVVILAFLNALILMGAMNQKTSRGNAFLTEWTEPALRTARYSPGDKIISSPFYGHSLAYYTDKKILADLYVEYANETKYRDAVEFHHTGNLSIMDKYNITTAVASPSKEVENTTILFENGHLSIHSIHKMFEAG